MEKIFKFNASSAASEFFEWKEARIGIYILHRKYQVKPNSSPWFSEACTAAIFHRYQFLRLFQQNKLSTSKVQLRRAINPYKIVLQTAKLAYSTKTNGSITSQKLGYQDFQQVANNVLNKVKSAIPPLFNDLGVLPYASDKAKLFPNFSKRSSLDDSGFCLLLFSSRTNLKLQNISITPKIVKKVLMNLDSSKASGLDCIPVVVLKNCEPELSYTLAKLFNICLKQSCLLRLLKGLISGRCI